MVRYSFQADDEDWESWKMTVPRNKSLEQRINELIRADRDGRVLDPEEAEPPADPPSEDPDAETKTPTPNGSETALHEPEMTVEWARDHAPVSRADIVDACYDEDAVEVSADTWWRKRARPALEDAGMEFTRNVGWR